MTPGAAIVPRATAIVPTMGTSPWLGRCLEALREAGGPELEIVLVAQGRGGLAAAESASRLADRTLRFERNAGFAVANNRALAATGGELVATVNDDAVVDAGWYRSLVAALDAEPQAAAAQGVNLRLGDPAVADGCGLEWNPHWQAVQIAHGQAPPPPSEPVREVFGVSATAALYRRSALAEVALAGEAFDVRLVSYYEDVDLACRLRAAGYGALLVPAARAEHAGSASGRRLALGGWRLVYGNRYLVLARLLGRAFGAELPRAWRRDARDLGAALARGDGRRAAGVVAGWGRAARLLPRYRHRGAPVVPLDGLEPGSLRW